MLAEQHLAYALAPIVIERIGQHYDDVLVYFRYDARAVEIIKRFPEWARNWDAEADVWRVHPGIAPRLAEILTTMGYNVISAQPLAGAA